MFRDEFGNLGEGDGRQVVVDLIEKEFQFKTFLAMKFTTQMLYYY